MKKIKVLVLSGGGLKGILTCAALINLRKKLGVPLNEYFDIIIGSSTGAIEGSLLAAGFEPEDILDFYFNYGKNIFTPVHSILLFWKRLNEPLYNRDRVLESLKENLNKKNITKLGDITKCEYIATSVNVLDEENVLFSSKDEKYKNVNIENIVARSFAAPYYFGLLDVPEEQTIYGDGGTGLANLPAVYGFVESLSNDKDSIIEMTCMGTGYYQEVLKYSDVKNYNNLDTIWKVYLASGDTLSRKQARSEQVSLLKTIDKKLDNFKLSYYDIQIPKNLDIMDGVKYMNDYKDYGSRIAF